MIFLAVLSAALMAGAGGGAGAAAPPEGIEARPPSVDPGPEGGYIATGWTYRAFVGPDGNLRSLRVGEVEMLDDQIAISLGAFFYAVGPVRLEQVSQPGPGLVVATNGPYTAEYHFHRREIRLTLHNRSESPVSYFVVLSPQVSVVTNLRTQEAAAAPTSEQWDDVRLSAPNGAFLELTGGGRLWGPWLERQVWWVNRLGPGEFIQLRMQAGVGDPPAPTLEQLVSLRARPAAPDGLTPEGGPLTFLVSIENRSEQGLSGLVSMELSATRAEQVVYTSRSVELPAKQTLELPFEARVAEPDFYRAHFLLSAQGRELAAGTAVAGHRPRDIRPATRRPRDFQEFWARLRQEVGEEPPPYQMELDPARSQPGAAVWLIRFEGFGGKTLHGWLLRPARPAPRPAVLYLSGYGARPIEPPVALAREGYVVLAMDVRGNPVGRPRPRPFEDYCTEGIESPDTYVYREIIGHYLRALRLLEARPETDPARIGLVGLSEGGGVGLMLAALHPRVRAVASAAPMLCDFPLSLRSAGWPYTEIARYLQAHPEQAEEVRRTLSYFDAANFAPQVRSPVLLSVGLLDRVSLPSAVYGVYNLLPGPKAIRLLPAAGHEGGDGIWDYKLQWLAEQLQPGAPEAGEE